MVKLAGLKARKSIRKRLKHMYFHVNFTHLFPKTFFTDQFWMTLQPRFYHTFVITLSFMFLLLLLT